MGSDLRVPGNGASAATSARNNVPDLHSNVASTDWRKKSQASAGKERLHARAACVQTSCGPENVAPTDSTRGKKLQRFTAAVCSWRRRRNSAAARRPPASRPSPSRRLNREARFAIFHKFWTTSPRDHKIRVVSFFVKKLTCGFLREILTRRPKPSWHAEKGALFGVLPFPVYCD